MESGDLGALSMIYLSAMVYHCFPAWPQQLSVSTHICLCNSIYLYISQQYLPLF